MVQTGKPKHREGARLAPGHVVGWPAEGVRTQASAPRLMPVAPEPLAPK